jgi:hypothetical protein
LSSSAPPRRATVGFVVLIQPSQTTGSAKIPQMLTKLSYSVTFPTTGRILAGDFDFKPGFGLITGANELGKSLIIEVVRSCLFGSFELKITRL